MYIVGGYKCSIYTRLDIHPMNHKYKTDIDTIKKYNVRIVQNRRIYKLFNTKKNILLYNLQKGKPTKLNDL